MTEYWNCQLLGYNLWVIPVILRGVCMQLSVKFSSEI